MGWCQMNRNCPECGKFMRKKGKGETTMYYCKECDEYYFNAIFSSAGVIFTSEASLRAQQNEIVKDLRLKKVDK